VITAEIDAATLKAPEWRQGGTARVSLEHERGAAAPIVQEFAIAPGQRTFSVLETGGGTLPPGRYVIRMAITAQGGAVPLQTVADVMVPNAAAMIGSSGLVFRRGPTTGLQYVQTADARFQRTERLRFEVPRLSPEGTSSARLLSRNGQLLPITATLTEREDDRLRARIIVADLTLAPLAQGEYVLEVQIDHDGKTERAVYAFRIVP
jgi:hypothetical protein